MSPKPVLTGPVGPRAEFDGREYLYFGGNNYLGLAQAPELRAAAVEAVERLGASVSASRRTSGDSAEHRALEAELASFCETEDALVFASGYLGNQLILQALVRPGTVVVHDAWSHPSLVDGIPRGVEARTFRHDDLDDLAHQLDGLEHAVVAADGVAQDGGIARLRGILDVIGQRPFEILLDEAHAAGVLGSHGRGTADHFAIDDERVHGAATLSKAFGSFGGYVAGDRALCDRIRDVSAPFVGSTPLPPAVVGAGRAAVRLVTQRPELRDRLRAHAARLAAGLADAGFGPQEPETPVFLIGEEGAGERLHEALRKEGILIPFVRYPRATSPGRLRLTVSAAHDDGDVERVLAALTDVSS